MGVSKKGRHKFVYKDTVFYWYVADWDLEEGYPLHIMSEDKAVQLRYGSKRFGLYQKEEPSEVLVIKSGKMKTGSYPFVLPLGNSGVKPSDIRAILDWYFTSVTKT